MDPNDCRVCNCLCMAFFIVIFVAVLIFEESSKKMASNIIIAVSAIAILVTSIVEISFITCRTRCNGYTTIHHQETSSVPLSDISVSET